jgi:hypothetical protein
MTTRLRWDKANVVDYYTISYNELNMIDIPTSFKDPNNRPNIKADINSFSNNIVAALQNAASIVIPRKKKTITNFGGTLSLIVQKVCLLNPIVLGFFRINLNMATCLTT